MNDVRISKFLSLVLRHKPEDAGLSLDENGWADLSALCAVSEKRFGADEADIRRVVAESNKQRFIIEGSRIRANQGHSVKVDLDLQPLEPPAVLYHGSVFEFSDSIAASGLIRGKRHHVHLSAETETAERVAARRNGPSLIYRVDASGMAAAGHIFYRSANGVWLTDHVPPEFLVTMTESG